MSEENKALEIAEKMLTGRDGGSGGILHFNLYDTIVDADELVRKAGGELRSRQAIAAIIACWKMMNPGVNPVGTGGHP